MTLDQASTGWRALGSEHITPLGRSLQSTADAMMAAHAVAVDASQRQGYGGHAARNIPLTDFTLGTLRTSNLAEATAQIATAVSKMMAGNLSRVSDTHRPQLSLLQHEFLPGGERAVQPPLSPAHQSPPPPLHSSL
jgi:hypothetical protein